jgi:23S rRNA pseudouridine1911/1915/1917 synthase
MSIQRFVVDQGAAGIRLDVYLTRNLAGAERPAGGFSRAEIQRLIVAGQVTFNGAPAKASARLKIGDCLEVRAQPRRESTFKAEALPLDIIYEDSDLIAINKAPGMVVHPAAGRPEGTLVNALLHHCPGLEGIGGERRPGIVHRLDKDTSGVMVVAKTNSAFHSLAAQFKNRTARKEYVALVLGNLSAERGVIDRPIGRHRSDRKRMSSLYFLNKSREARTEWNVEERFALLLEGKARQWLTLLRLRPRTGRTHQIRVHLADLGYPVVGDRVYGRKRRTSAAPAQCDAEVARFPRQALHAERLIVKHPRSGQSIDFFAPLPDDLRDLLGYLRGHSAARGATMDGLVAQGVDKKRAFK